MFSGPEPFINFGRGHYGEHSCETILNLDQWFKMRCRLKKVYGRRTPQEDRSQ